MARRRPRPTPAASATLAEMPDALLTWRGASPGEAILPARAAWLAERDAWLAAHDLLVTDRELRAERRRRLAEHLTEHPQDRVRRPRRAAKNERTDP